MAWLRVTVQASILGSMYFSANHLIRMGRSPSLEKLMTKRRSLVLPTSSNAGTAALGTSVSV